MSSAPNSWEQENAEWLIKELQRMREHYETAEHQRLLYFKEISNLNRAVGRFKRRYENQRNKRNELQLKLDTLQKEYDELRWRMDGLEK